MQVWHRFAHECELFGACAVAGVVGCGLGIQKPCGVFQFGAGGEFGEVEAADKVVGLEPGDDVQNTFVGATAEEDAFAVFFNEQVLFMAEVVFRDNAVFYAVQAKAAHVVGAGVGITGTEVYTVGGMRLLIYKNQSFMVGQGGIQADIFMVSVEMRLKSIGAHINGCLVVQLQKGFQTAAVVVVAVGEDCDVNERKVDSQLRGIYGKQIALPHVK